MNELALYQGVSITAIVRMAVTAFLRTHRMPNDEMHLRMPQGGGDLYPAERMRLLSRQDRPAALRTARIQMHAARKDDLGNEALPA